MWSCLDVSTLTWVTVRLYLALPYEVVPCQLGSSALGLTGLLCAGTENTFSDLLAYVRPEKGFHHLVFIFFVFCTPDALP